MRPDIIGNLAGISFMMFVFGSPVFVVGGILYLALSKTVAAVILSVIKVILWVSGVCCVPFVLLLTAILIGTILQKVKKHGV